MLLNSENEEGRERENIHLGGDCQESTTMVEVLEESADHLITVSLTYY